MQEAGHADEAFAQLARGPPLMKSRTPCLKSLKSQLKSLKSWQIWNQKSQKCILIRIFSYNYMIQVKMKSLKSLKSQWFRNLVQGFGKWWTPWQLDSDGKGKVTLENFLCAHDKLPLCKDDVQYALESDEHTTSTTNDDRLVRFPSETWDTKFDIIYT